MSDRFRALVADIELQQHVWDKLNVSTMRHIV